MIGKNNETLASRLNKRGDILRPPSPEEVDDAGQPLDKLVPVFLNVWAGIEPLRGREFFSAQQDNSEVTTRIRVRYREGIDRTMTFKYMNHEFEILYIIQPDFNKRELQLMCKERQ